MMQDSLQNTHLTYSTHSLKCVICL